MHADVGQPGSQAFHFRYLAAAQNEYSLCRVSYRIFFCWVGEAFGTAHVKQVVHEAPPAKGVWGYVPSEIVWLPNEGGKPGDKARG